MAAAGKHADARVAGLKVKSSWDCAVSTGAGRSRVAKKSVQGTERNVELVVMSDLRSGIDLVADGHYVVPANQQEHS